MSTSHQGSSLTGPGSVEGRVPTKVAEACSVAFAILITVADRLTDPYLSFAAFYLIPVAVMAWYSTRVRALVFTLLITSASIVTRALDPGEISQVVNVVNGLLRVVMFVFVVLLVEAERTARERIARLSTLDPLTGVLNRRAFMYLGTDRLHQAARRSAPVALVYIDLDDLKVRNDEFGHESGDRMIIDFADAMIATFRTTDLVTRIGGDEFCCLLDDTDQEEAEAVLSRFEAVLTQIGPEPLRASMGAVATIPTATTSIDALIRAADALMYEAKLSGKGRHRTSTIPPPEATSYTDGTEPDR